MRACVCWCGVGWWASSTQQDARPKHQNPHGGVVRVTGLILRWDLHAARPAARHLGRRQHRYTLSSAVGAGGHGEGLVASGSEDGKVLLWHAGRGEAPVAALRCVVCLCEGWIGMDGRTDVSPRPPSTEGCFSPTLTHTQRPRRHRFVRRLVPLAPAPPGLRLGRPHRPPVGRPGERRACRERGGWVRGGGAGSWGGGEEGERIAGWNRVVVC